MQYIKEVILIFEKTLEDFGGNVIPCTQEQVDALESMIKPPYHLPGAYKEFLKYGGMEMGDLFGVSAFSYRTAKLMLETRNADFIDALSYWQELSEVPADMFIISEHLGAFFDYFKLTEGEDPPVYSWDETKHGGLEAAYKRYDSFSDFLRAMIRVDRIYSMPKLISKKKEAKQPLRGVQFWDFTPQEQTEGVEDKTLIEYFGFWSDHSLTEAATLCGLSPEQYLEELTGWKCQKVVKNGELKTYFFPPRK
jgi:hypothetical protein